MPILQYRIQRCCGASRAVRGRELCLGQDVGSQFRQGHSHDQQAGQAEEKNDDDRDDLQPFKL